MDGKPKPKPASSSSTTSSSSSSKKKPPPSPPTVEAWVTQQKAALQEEREEEKQEVTAALAQLTPQECQEKGVSLLYLNIIGTSTGLYGRTCISLGPSTALRKDGTLPAHGFSSGDEVVLRSMKGSSSTSSSSSSTSSNSSSGGGGGGGGGGGITGVVTRTTASKVEFVASADEVDEELLEGWAAAGPGSGHLRLDMLANEATHQKMMKALDHLLAYPSDGPAARLVNMCFGGRTSLSSLPPPHVTSHTLPPSGTPWLSGARLNEDQRAAIALGLATDDVALIHGPPGTGKTTAVVELILQAVHRHKRRLLVCAPSNVAVDNIVERIAAAAATATTSSSSSSSSSSKKSSSSSTSSSLPSSSSFKPPRIVRLGHPARLSPTTLTYSLDALIATADGTSIVSDIRAELSTLEKKKFTSRGLGLKQEKRAWRQEMKALKKEVRVREEGVVRDLLKSRDIVLCTCVGAATRLLREERFDMVVIDEAAQSLEAACWIPMLKASRVVLAGDHKQLPPTIKSGKADKMGLGVTLFDRLMALDEAAWVPPSLPPSIPPSLSSSSQGREGRPGGREGGREGGSAGNAGEEMKLLSSSNGGREGRPGGREGGRARMLTVQYRMHADICGWASKAMYNNLLVPDPSVASRTLEMLREGGREGGKEGQEDEEGGKEGQEDEEGGKEGKKKEEVKEGEVKSKKKEKVGREGGREDEEEDDDMTKAVLLLLDTAGCGMDEEEGEREKDKDTPPSLPPSQNKKSVRPRSLLSSSRSNEGEALVVSAHVHALLKNTKLTPEEIAVITPYNAQVELLRSLLHPAFPSLEIRSVDGFQGGEREAVILSLVRSNARGEVGFLKEDRRLNVAVTRAKRHVCVVGDSETVGKHPFLKGLLTWMEEEGDVRSALEYVPEWGGAGGGGGGGGREGGGGGAGGKGGGKEGGKKEKGKVGAAAAGGVKTNGSAAVTVVPPSSSSSSSSSNNNDPAQEGENEEEGQEQQREQQQEQPARPSFSDSSIPDNQLVAQVLQFCLSPSSLPPSLPPSLPRRLALPPDLSGRQRKLVHDLVEGLKLSPPITHTSQGVGRKRRLVLERTLPPSLPSSGLTPTGGGEEEEEEEEDEEEDEGEEEEEAVAPAAAAAAAAATANKKKKKKKTTTSTTTTNKNQEKQQQQQLQQNQDSPPFDSLGGGSSISSGKQVPPLKGNMGLGSLHAERLARQQQLREQHQQHQQQQQAEASAMAAAKKAAKKKTKEGGREEEEEEEDDDLAALEEAMQANANIKEWPRPPSEGMKKRLYGWDRNPQKKDLRASLKGKLAESEEKRKPAAGGGKKEEKKGGGGGGAGGGGAGRR